MLDTNGIYQKLNKYLNENFTADEIDCMEFYVDVENPIEYIWTFDLKQKRYRLVHDKYEDTIRCAVKDLDSKDNRYIFK